MENSVLVLCREIADILGASNFPRPDRLMVIDEKHNDTGCVHEFGNQGFVRTVLAPHESILLFAHIR